MTPTTRETADHAELARLAEAATPGPWKSIIDDTGGERSGWPLCIVPENGDDRSVVRTGGMWPYEWDAKVSQHEAVSTAAFIAAANPATVLALLSEIAALRSALDVCDTARLHWQEVVVPALGDRATQAERQRDELRKALEWYGEQARLARLIHREGDAGRHALADDGGKRARQALADRGADQ